MKSEKGATLISLTVYVIVLSVVIGVMGILSGFFFKNIKNVKDINPLTEFTKFNSFFTDEINHKDIKVLECKTNGNNSYIVFSNGVQYSFIAANKGIYKNKTKICNSIDKCQFTTINTNGKEKIKVEFQAGELTKNITYKLK